MSPVDDDRQRSGPAETTVAAAIIGLWAVAAVIVAIAPPDGTRASDGDGVSWGVRAPERLVSGLPSSFSSRSNTRTRLQFEQADTTGVDVEERLLRAVEAARAEAESDADLAHMAGLPVFSSEGVHVGRVCTVGTDGDGHIRTVLVVLHELGSERPALPVAASRTYLRRKHVEIGMTQGEASLAATNGMVPHGC